MKVLIAGGGIGGLVTALELHKRGIEAQVFESIDEPKALGVGINLLPHAMKNLIQLGLLEPLMATGIQTKDLSFYSKHGKLIWREPRGLDAGYKVPQLSINRGELQMILYRAARERLGANIHTGHHFKDYRETADGRVVATFTDRKSGTTVAEADGDVLIGADGIHSALRRKLVPQAGPGVWSGMMFWRGAVETEQFLSGRSMIMAGYPDRKVIVYPMSKPHFDKGKSLTNWAVDYMVDRTGAFNPEDWDRRGDRSEFMPAFAGWRFDWLDVPDLLARTETVYEYPCVDHEPLERWTFGRATLLGDAAHPMRPMGSNAGSQAIRDARAIAEALAGTRDIDAALAAYENERRPATTRIVLSNKMSGPERVMQMVEDRAPDGFNDLHAVISEKELQAVADEYKTIAGFDRDSVNAGVDAPVAA